ncbi:hypothetical protein HCN44_009650 [Aphidius gifuensis]|uniref:Uncharacterized protein n=1 Tax=Aphidius gifuensis TaxID=684658 RepID=A0A835CW87_APHGI|nr:uncharacterized protein LOC122860433 [Aphidius gifuensis]KAF7998252.1 hypothetical protein HCN44_009650 [Aphidius gifuensis]
MQLVTKLSLLLQLFVSIHTIVILISCLSANVNLTSASSLKHDVSQKESKNNLPLNINDGKNDDEDISEEKLCISCELMTDSLNTIKILMNKLEDVSKKYCSATFSAIEKKSSDTRSRGSRAMTNLEDNDEEQYPQVRWKSPDFMRGKNGDVNDRYRPPGQGGQAGQGGRPVPPPPQALPMPRFPTRGPTFGPPRGGNRRGLVPIKNITNPLEFLNLNVEKEEQSGHWKGQNFIKSTHDGIRDILRPVSSLLPVGLAPSIPLITHRSSLPSRQWKDPTTQQENNDKLSSTKFDSLSQLLTLNNLFPRDEQDIMITENDDIPTIVIHDEKELENYKNEDMVFFLCSKMKNSRRHLQTDDLKSRHNKPTRINKAKKNKENTKFHDDDTNINTNINLNNIMN